MISFAHTVGGIVGPLGVPACRPGPKPIIPGPQRRLGFANQIITQLCNNAEEPCEIGLRSKGPLNLTIPELGLAWALHPPQLSPLAALVPPPPRQEPRYGRRPTAGILPLGEHGEYAPPLAASTSLLLRRRRPCLVQPHILERLFFSRGLLPRGATGTGEAGEEGRVEALAGWELVAYGGPRRDVLLVVLRVSGRRWG